VTLAKRIIPCLDVDGGRVVKGIKFQNLRDVGDPVELAARYEEQGADEVVFLDISASHEGRATTLEMVRETAEKLTIPLTVGGGISSPAHMRNALNAGADKVAINTAALDYPELINECSQRFGAQCVVVAVDAKSNGDGTWNCYSRGGRTDTHRDLIEWCKEATERGAGEILLTSMDADGVKTGYDVAMLQAVAGAVAIPVVASGGCGEPGHMVGAFESGADAALAASIFHDGIHTVAEAKQTLAAAGLPIRPLEVTA
jgi:cyclase